MQEFLAAFSIAVRLLSQRAYTRRVLSEKLQQRGVDQTIADRVVEECERLGYVNDRRFAAAFKKRMTEKGYGSRHVKLTMQKKGFGDEDIAVTFSCPASETDEKAAAEKAFKKKLKALERLRDNAKKKEKLYRYLSSRGFSGSMIRDLLQSTPSEFG